MVKNTRLLIGYDGSACADAALADLKNAGLPRLTDVLILSAVDVFLPKGREIKIPDAIKASIQRSRAAARNELKLAAASAQHASVQLKSLFPSWNVKSESCADSPAWALLKKAHAWKANLIMVGAHGHSQLGRFLGSVSQMILTQAECSVRVGRVAPNPKEKRLLVLIGIDGSPDSAAAVQAAASRRWPSDTKFLLVSVIDPKKSTFIERLAPSDIRWFLEHADDEHQVVGKMLESYAKIFRNNDADVTCEIIDGNPIPALIKEAETARADCIFLGARGLTHANRFFMGGVSMAVAARAHCSVEVVRPSRKNARPN